MPGTLSPINGTTEKPGCPISPPSHRRLAPHCLLPFVIRACPMNRPVSLRQVRRQLLLLLQQSNILLPNLFCCVLFAGLRLRASLLVSCRCLSRALCLSLLVQSRKPAIAFQCKQHRPPHLHVTAVHGHDSTNQPDTRTTMATVLKRAAVPGPTSTSTRSYSLVPSVTPLSRTGPTDDSTAASLGSLNSSHEGSAFYLRLDIGCSHFHAAGVLRLLEG